MTEIIFTFHSTNAAIKAETVLVQAGLDVRVMSLPSSIKAGCGICLRISPAEVTSALQSLEQSNVDISELWARISDNGASRYEPMSRESL